MKFEQTGETDYPHRLIFEGDEVEVIRAVYRELTYNLARKGNVGSISEHETAIAGWEDDKICPIPVASLEFMVERLDVFHANTDEAIQEVAEVSGVPAFDNEYIPLRHQLGEKALRLADEIRQRTMREPEIPADLDQEFSKILGDKGRET